MRFYLYDSKTKTYAQDLNNHWKARVWYVDESNKPKGHRTVPLIEYAITSALNRVYHHKYKPPSKAIEYALYVDIGLNNHLKIFSTTWNFDKPDPFMLVFNREIQDPILKKKCLEAIIKWTKK